jgi:hypothetical protein
MQNEHCKLRNARGAVGTVDCEMDVAVGRVIGSLKDDSSGRQNNEA